jgi:DNA-directed RNA polymerase specialized sigma24 family protein
MSHEILAQLSLSGIAHRCAQETQLFFQRRHHDPSYCFELFRRAIVNHCQRAWELVYEQYRPQVASWVQRHAAFATSGEEVQYFVNRAFEKMWTALTPAKIQGFPELSALLSYFKTCVHSAILDLTRKKEHLIADVPIEMLPSDEAVEDQVLDRTQGRRFWDEIRARIKNDQERIVIYESYVLGLRPREICNRHPGGFYNVKEVYRVKENVLARLRRDEELARIFCYDA